MKKFTLLSAVFVLLFIAPAFVQPGTLDNTFGKDKNGKVTPVIAIGVRAESHAVAVQPDGKIVTAGYSDAIVNGSFTPLDFVLMRHRSDGTLDHSFGNEGKVTTDFGRYEEAHSVAIQADGKLVVAGSSYNEQRGYFALARYLKNGNLDTAFGEKGKVITDVGGNDYGEAVAIQSDGKIVVAGVSQYLGSDVGLARYLQNGKLDKTFGNNGKVITDFGGFDLCWSVAIQADGKIVAAGYSEDDFALARYKQNGILDSAFGVNGKVITHFKEGSSYGYSVAVQANGKIVVAGMYAKVFDSNDFALARYRQNGILDSTFGVNGQVLTDFHYGSYGYEKAQSVTIQPDGKIIAAGYSDGNFALARYRQNGKLDSDFGVKGKVTTNPGGVGGQAFSVALQTDGKIVVAGYAYFKSNTHFAIARFNGGATVFTNNSDDHISFLQKHENNTSASVYLSPNPVTDILHIENLPSSSKTISIIDITGRLSQKVTTTNSNYSFNVKQLPAGTYFVRINEADKSTTLTFVKE